jgi:hypothetical protein
MQLSLKRRASTIGVALLTLGCVQAADTAGAGTTLPETPDGTVVAVAQKLVNHHPEIVWEALPESYRADINELTSTFAERMDPEVYDQVMALAIRAVEVLQQKKDLILASEAVESAQIDPEDFDSSMTGGIAVAQTVLSSEISTLAGLGAINWQQYLATTGRTLMDQAGEIEIEEGEDPMADLETLEVETLEIGDDTAKLRLVTADDEPEEIDLVRVEGRWVPAEMAAKWPEAMANARHKLDEMTPEKVAEMKGQALMGLAMAEGVIEQIAATETVEDFDAMIGPMLQGIMGNLNFAGGMESEEEDGNVGPATE